MTTGLVTETVGPPREGGSYIVPAEPTPAPEGTETTETGAPPRRKTRRGKDGD